MGLEEKVESIFEETAEHRVEIRIGKDSYKILLLTKNGVLTDRKEEKQVRFEYQPKGDSSENIYLICIPGTTITGLPYLIKYRKAWERLNEFLVSPENRIQNQELKRRSIIALSEHLRKDKEIEIVSFE